MPKYSDVVRIVGKDAQSVLNEVRDAIRAHSEEDLEVFHREHFDARDYNEELDVMARWVDIQRT